MAEQDDRTRCPITAAAAAKPETRNISATQVPSGPGVEGREPCVSTPCGSGDALVPGGRQKNHCPVIEAAVLSVCSYVSFTGSIKYLPDFITVSQIQRPIEKAPARRLRGGNQTSAAGPLAVFSRHVQHLFELSSFLFLELVRLSGLKLDLNGAQDHTVPLRAQLHLHSRRQRHSLHNKQANPCHHVT